MIHKEGYPTLILVAVLGIGINLAIYFLSGSVSGIGIGISQVVFIFFIQFFRNPQPNIYIDERGIIAPADGKVVVVEDTTEPEVLEGKKVKQISIFMSPFNVHVNRMPVSGKTFYDKYHKGKFLVAWHPKSSTENERSTLGFETKHFGKIVVRQIAGFLARRIVYYSKTGDSLPQGKEFGFIKFGSRVDIFIPIEAKVLVKIGDKTKGGETLLATI